ncbi:hypothetical protein ES708_21093 [subsurface metagenome]
MTIDEARDILTLKTKGRDILSKQREIEAEKLGIEALKRVQEYRSMEIVSGGWRLPGETEK